MLGHPERLARNEYFAAPLGDSKGSARRRPGPGASL